MEKFKYIDIFASKGTEYIVVIAFLVLLVIFWKVLDKQTAKKIKRALGFLTANILRIPQGLFYSGNHTWVHMERSGHAKIGLDDLIQHITGEVNFSVLKAPGETINKGDLLTEIEKNGKKLEIFAPISGTIQHTNTSLKENPDILNEEPYEDGWIYTIKPSNWKADTESFYFADEATDWIKTELVRFKDFLAVSMQKHAPDPTMIAYQDGGELIDHTLSDLPNEVWADFQKEFLN